MRRFVTVVALLVVAACNGSDRGGRSVFVPSIPDVQGDWRGIGAFTTETCPAGAARTLTSHDLVYRITQVDASIQITFYDLCGRPALVPDPVFLGAIDANRTFTAVFEFTQVASQSCTRRMKHEITGMVNESGDAMQGSEVFTITPMGDCDPFTAQCFVSGTFNATRCPPADCSFQPLDSMGRCLI